MASAPIDLPQILDTLARVSKRPRFAFMVLNLVSEAAGASGRAGPYVVRGETRLPVRDWLCDAVAPMANRDPRRRRLEAAVRADLAGRLPADPAEADEMIAVAVRERVRSAGRPNISRATSELVRAGYLRRYYEGYRVNHRNRGAGRMAVYVLDAEAQAALRRGGGQLL